jgi:hypothetical protein
MFRIEHNVETGEIKEIPLTPAEIKEKEKEMAQAAEKASLEASEINAKLAEKNALLEQLGITEDQAKLLLS